MSDYEPFSVTHFRRSGHNWVLWHFLVLLARGNHNYFHIPPRTTAHRERLFVFLYCIPQHVAQRAMTCPRATGGIYVHFYLFSVSNPRPASPVATHGHLAVLVGLPSHRERLATMTTPATLPCHASKWHGHQALSSSSCFVLNLVFLSATCGPKGHGSGFSK